MAIKLHPDSVARFAALARERTPAKIRAERDAIEAEYMRESDWRKSESMRNVKKWVALRRARGAHQ